MSKKITMKKNEFRQMLGKYDLYLALVFAFVWRLFFFVSLRPWDTDMMMGKLVESDALDYYQLAQSILADHSFVHFGAFRTPVYPLFLAAIFGVFANAFWLAFLIQIAINLITIFLVFRIASLAFSRKVALVAALLCAIDPCQALYTVVLVTESLFNAAFLGAIYLLSRKATDKKLVTIFLSALMLGVATLIKPITFLFPIVGLFFIAAKADLNWRTKTSSAGVFCATFLLAISPWLVRNHATYGVASLSSISGSNLLYYNVGYTEVYRTGKSIEEVLPSLKAEAVSRGADTINGNPFINSNIYSQIATRYIKTHLALYTKRHLMGIGNMVGGLATKPMASNFHLRSNPQQFNIMGGGGLLTQIETFYRYRTIQEILLSFVMVGFLAPTYLFAMAGVLSAFRLDWIRSGLLVMIAVYFAGLTGVVGDARYRLPLMPAIYIFSAVGLIWAWGKTFKFRKAVD